MASIIADIIALIADAIEEAEVAEEIADAVEAATEFMEESANAVYNNAVGEGATDEEALQQSVNDIYNNLAEYDENLANQWNYIQQKEYPGNPNASTAETNPGTGESYDTTDPDSNPDMGDQDEVDDPDDPDEKINCEDEPANTECEKAKSQNTKKYWKWLTSLTGLATIAGILGYFIGALARGICQFLCWLRGRCNKDSDGKCGKCEKYGCTCEGYCTPGVCKQIKDFIQGLRKYWTIILLGYIIVAAILIFFFKSIGVAVFLLVVLGILWLCKSWLGNAIATIVCNWAASVNLFKCGDVVCNR